MFLIVMIQLLTTLNNSDMMVPQKELKDHSDQKILQFLHTFWISLIYLYISIYAIYINTYFKEQVDRAFISRV